MQAIELGEHGLSEEVHEPVHFVLRTLPVFRGERIDGEVIHAHIVRAADSLAHRIDARFVAVQTVHSALFGPTPVPVHDNGNMARYAALVELGRIEPRRGIGEDVIQRLPHTTNSPRTTLPT